MYSTWMTHTQSHASFTNMAEDSESDIAIRFVDETTTERFLLKLFSETEIKKESPFLSCIELTVQQGNPQHTEYCLRIIYNLQFEESNFWFDIYSFISPLLFNKNNTWRPTCFTVQTTGFNRPAKCFISLKHWSYENFELNWFHGLSKSLSIPFSHFASIFRNALDLFTLSLPFVRHVLHGV